MPTRQARAPWIAHLVAMAFAGLCVAAVYGGIGLSGAAFAVLAFFVGAKYLGMVLAYAVVSSIPVFFMRRAWQPLAMHGAVVLVLFQAPGEMVSWRYAQARARSEAIAPKVRRCFHLERWSEKVTPFHVHVHVEGTVEIAGEVSLSVEDNGFGRGYSLGFDPAQTDAVPGQPVVLDTDETLEVQDANSPPVRELHVKCQGGEHIYRTDATEGSEMLEFGTVSIEHLLPAPEST